MQRSSQSAAGIRTRSAYFCGGDYLLGTRSIARVSRPLRSILVVVLLAAFLPIHHSSGATASNKLFVFYGQIESVDAASGTFTLRSDKGRHVFVVTENTKISRHGAGQRLKNLKPRQPAEVEMRIGAGGKGYATSVKLMLRDLTAPPSAPPPEAVQSLVAATTPGGKRLSAAQLKPLVLHATFPREHHRVIGYLSLKTGVFLMSVRSDGTVENVEVLQTVGHRGADADMVKALRKWRFRPNSVKEVRVPSQYAFSR